MDEFIPKGEYEADLKRLEAEDNRQNHRIELLEENVKEVSGLTRSVDILANNMASMLKEQEKQGQRLESIEKRDGEKWREFAKIALSALVGGIIGFLLKQVGLI